MAANGDGTAQPTSSETTNNQNDCAQSSIDKYMSATPNFVDVDKPQTTTATTVEKPPSENDAQKRARELKESRDKIYNEVRQHFVDNKMDVHFLENSLRSYTDHLYMNTRLPLDLARVLKGLVAISERELQDCAAKNTPRDQNAFLYECLCKSNSGEALAEGLYKTENYAILEFIHTNVVKGKQ